jgi:hypothetical protein
MKRMISLTALIICSFTISFGATQTWRLTNNSNNDNKPHIELTNSGKVWVVWLSDEDGDFDVHAKRYNIGAWESEFKFNGDSINQTTCEIAKDSLNSSLFIAWDSAGQVQVAHYLTSWYVTNIADSLHLLCNDSNIYLTAGDSGKAYVAWSSGILGQVSAYLKMYTGIAWDTIQAVRLSYGSSWQDDSHYLKGIMSFKNELPAILCYSEWSGIMTSTSGTDLGFYYCLDGSAWIYENLASFGYSIGVPYGAPYKEVGIGYDSIGNLITVFCDSVASGSGTLKCNKYSATDYQYLETYILQANAKVHSGTVSKGLRPVAVWSDSQRIYASAFYDSMWSTIPTLISDSSLTNCINPDIVVENDSTMWVCYESNSEIYVTRTFVPLGITGDRPEPNKIAVKPFVHAYPNPASNRVNISYNNNGPAVISIYDITGGRIRSLTANNGQAVWDCRNGQGQQVSSGVYFIRARQDNNEIIKKINIVR